MLSDVPLTVPNSILNGFNAHVEKYDIYKIRLGCFLLHFTPCALVIADMRSEEQWNYRSTRLMVKILKTGAN